MQYRHKTVLRFISVQVLFTMNPQNSVAAIKANASGQLLGLHILRINNQPVVLAIITSSNNSRH